MAMYMYNERHQRIFYKKIYRLKLGCIVGPQNNHICEKYLSGVHKLRQSCIIHIYEYEEGTREMR